MKELYHICFTSHDEVMFRDEEDHGMFVNIMALQSYSTGTEILADAEMSTHVHQAVFTDNPSKFASFERMSYTRYFNWKYSRKGRFGQKYTFVLQAKGHYHVTAMLSYIMRNGLHHAASSTAFGYPYCSIRDMFVEDLAIQRANEAITSRKDIMTYLPKGSVFPDSYLMDTNGVFQRSCFMELRRAEQYYATPRNFLYQMNRISDEAWIKEQLTDNTGSPITLSDIECTDKKTVEQLLRNEYGRYFSRTRLQDMDVCRLIDTDLLPSFDVPSVYMLTDSQKQRLTRLLKYEYHLPDSQIGRCLVL